MQHITSVNWKKSLKENTDEPRKARVESCSELFQQDSWVAEKAKKARMDFEESFGKDSTNET